MKTHFRNKHGPIAGTSSGSNNAEVPSTGVPTPAKQPRITSYTISTTEEQKDTFDHAVGKFFFANNIPFRCVESSFFHDLVKLLRPGYKLPSRKLMSTKILDNVNKELEEQCKAKLSGKKVTIAIDGWSNLSNDPNVASSIQHGDKVYIVDSIDTSGEHHTSEYLTSVSQGQIKVAEEKFGRRMQRHTVWMRSTPYESIGKRFGSNNHREESHRNCTVFSEHLSA